MGNNITQAVGGDRTHQMVALSYTKQGVSPVDAMAELKKSNYIVAINGAQFKLKASSVASIMTGFNLLIHQVSTGRASLTAKGGLKWK